MLTTIHLLAGSAIGKGTGNIYSAALLGFAAHYLLDSIPHYNHKPVKGYHEHGLMAAHQKDILLKSIEPIIGVVLTFYIIFANPIEIRPPIVVGAFFGWLPDLLVFLDWKFGMGRNSPLRRIERKWHHHTDFVKGLVPQVILAALILLYFFK